MLFSSTLPISLVVTMIPYVIFFAVALTLLYDMVFNVAGPTSCIPAVYLSALPVILLYDIVLLFTLDDTNTPYTSDIPSVVMLLFII